LWKFNLAGLNWLKYSFYILWPSFCCFFLWRRIWLVSIHFNFHFRFSGWRLQLFVHFIHLCDKHIINIKTNDWRVKFVENSLDAALIKINLHAIVRGSYLLAILQACYSRTHPSSSFSNLRSLSLSQAFLNRPSVSRKSWLLSRAFNKAFNIKGIPVSYYSW